MKGKKKGSRAKVAKGVSPKKAEKPAPTITATRSRDFSADLAVYLNTWSEDKASWKFNKVLQNFLLDNIMDSKKIDKELFRSASAYLASIQGGARDRLLSRVQKILDGEDDNDNDNNHKTGEDGKPTEAAPAPTHKEKELVLKRAIKIQSSFSVADS